VPHILNYLKNFKKTGEKNLEPWDTPPASPTKHKQIEDLSEKKPE